jgi:glycerol-3-phosphate O-acyltransferase
MTDSFDDIRPFTDAEVDTVLARLLNEPAFNQAIRFVFPNSEPEDIRHLLGSIHTIADFQAKIVSAAVKAIAEKSTAGLEVRGLDKLDSQISYLFISNHRDIVLDSAFLNYILFTHGFSTTRIAIGNNLLQREWIADLVKLNKNFVVQRNVPPRQAYEYSLRLSNYIKKSLVDDASSVWIAQREGRTKDGMDQTQAGLLKMLSLAWGDDVVDGFEKMQIVPVSISYGVEPCAGLKARELFIKQRDGAYEKQPGEDLNSMLEGIRAWKGKVVFTFGKTIVKNELQHDFAEVNRNEGIKNLCARIDARISEGYALQPFNYIAADLLRGTKHYASHYSADDCDNWNKHIDQQLSFQDVTQSDLLQGMLAMYAAPVNSKG